MAIPFTQKRLISVEEYHKMAEAGILAEDERVELIQGEIIQMSPIGSAHAGKVNRIGRVFHRLLGDDVIVSIQNPVYLGEYSEPEPDLAILHFREDFYESHHPRVEEIHLLVEIAETSLKKDKEMKLPLYASCLVPEVWIVDVKARLISVYRNPQEGFYTEQRTVESSSSIPLGSLGIVIPVIDLLG